MWFSPFERGQTESHINPLHFSPTSHLVGNTAKIFFSFSCFFLLSLTHDRISVGQQGYSHSCCVVHQSVPLSNLHSHTSAVVLMLPNNHTFVCLLSSFNLNGQQWDCGRQSEHALQEDLVTITE